MAWAVLLRGSGSFIAGAGWADETRSDGRRGGWDGRQGRRMGRGLSFRVEAPVALREKLTGKDWFEQSGVKRDPETVARTKVVVAGGGSFGTAMSFVLANNGYPVTMLVRNEPVMRVINEEHHNPKHLSDFELPQNISASNDPKETLADAELLVHAIPVQASRAFLDSIVHYLPSSTPVLCTSKGLEIESRKLMCDLLPEVLGKRRRIAYLSGPSFAREMMQKLPTAVVVASKDLRFAEDLAAMLSSPNFKVFTSKDTVGLEVAGAVKNVIAIAAGMSDGLGLGTNAMAALVTRGCSEMRRLAEDKGGSSVTLSGLSGVGDTFLTCFGPLSRNRTVGVRLGKGETLSAILESTQEVAEGVVTASALVQWLGESHRSDGNVYASRAAVKYPILFGVAAILEGRLTPREGMEYLLAMPPRPED